MKKLIALAVLVALLPACVGYYGQAVRGQWELIRKPRPIQEVLAEDGTDTSLKNHLSVALTARAFASQELGLPDNASYTEYADLERPYVVWSVVAAPRYSLDPKTWCFPFAGCVNYRGYFKQASADKYAKRLQDQGYDVSVGGVPAYSTLGKFNDPILNTMLRGGDDGVVSTMFHELAHQKIYVKGDTAFNEAFASAVEEEGMRRWFLRSETDPSELQVYQASKKRRGGFTRIVGDAQVRLRDVYARDIPDDEKEVLKQQELVRLKDDYKILKQEWDGHGGYDNWFDRELNNAHLASIASYESLLPAFRVILSQENKDLTRFYERCEAMANMTQEQRDRAVQELMAVVAQATRVSK